MSGQPKTMTLVLDESDYQAIRDAICKRKLFPLPETESTGDGGVVADICRRWSVMAECRPENLALLRRAIIGLMDVDTNPTVDDLDGMEALIRMTQAPDADKAAAINALDALRKTSYCSEQFETTIESTACQCGCVDQICAECHEPC